MRKASCLPSSGGCKSMSRSDSVSRCELRDREDAWGGDMESMIAKLLEDFERGKMTRRQLINSLAVVGTIASNATALAAEKTKGFKAVAVNHISYQVSDYAKTRDFYADLLGMKVMGDNGKQCELVLGESNTFVIPRNAPAGTTPPRVDHIAYTIRRKIPKTVFT